MINGRTNYRKERRHLSCQILLKMVYLPSKKSWTLSCLVKLTANLDFQIGVGLSQTFFLGGGGEGGRWGEGEGEG